VSLPQINLDDRGFQDLVSEARLRIAQSCPEWTEHNVSDPGITLIELFAWMTDMLTYRLNRIPDKLHIALLNLLGVRLHGPTAARAQVRFRLVAPPEQAVEIPAGLTEVATRRSAAEEAIIFQVSEGFSIAPRRPTAYVIQPAGEPRALAVADGVARPQGRDQMPFAMPPAADDAFYLGFDEDLARLILRVEIDASIARGAGVDPEHPPLVWEVSQGAGEWVEAEVLSDDTGGFNLGSGTVELQCPDASGIANFGGHRRHWVRCRVADRPQSGEEGGAYTHPPAIYSITAAPIGALLPAEHCSTRQEESLGTSDGTPGQQFRLRFAPVLPLGPDQTLEVREPGAERWSRWTPVESFAESGPRDRHFVVDTNAGEIELGPAVRQPDGGWAQFGAVPAQGASLRMTSYSHGGGRLGNVAPETLTTLRSAIPGVSAVTNPRAAHGGVDGESLTSARQRASLEVRTRARAVTADDYEFLVGQASARVGRALCMAPSAPTEPIRIHVMPRVDDAERQLAFDELNPNPELLQTVSDYLDERRMIGTSVHLLPVRLRGVSVVVNLQAEPRVGLQRVEEEVLQALYTYLNPLVGGSALGPSSGWPFGRLLNQGELFQIVHSVEGVQFVKLLRVYETDVRTGEQSPQPAGSHLTLEPDELIASGTHQVRAVYPESG
jgi:predicted phage baseplate assembly protein